MNAQSLFLFTTHAISLPANINKAISRASESDTRLNAINVISIIALISDVYARHRRAIR